MRAVIWLDLPTVNKFFIWAFFLGTFSAAQTRPSVPVSVGIDVLLQDGASILRGKKVALITHAAAVTADLEATADALFRAPGVKLVALMGPEHGIRGAAYAGDKIADQKDPKTQVPVFSLFGNTQKPTPEMLKGVDVVVYDVQDIGVRSYTYISTLAMAMEAAADAGIPFIILDRPDPLGGLRIEGNLPPKDWKPDFVDYLPVPYVYGMTPGELAQMINGEGWLSGGKRCKLQVVPMKGWRRDMLFSDTGRIWAPTSPHIPHAETALFYAATGIVGELQTVSEGVGYTLPFEVLGAPWIDGQLFAKKMNELNLPGLIFRPIFYTPFYATYKGELCGGVQIHIIDDRRAPLTEIQFYAIEVLRSLYPDHKILEPADPKKLEKFDSVNATASIREKMDSGQSVKALAADWRKDDDDFARRRAKYLIYP